MLQSLLDRWRAWRCPNQLVWPDPDHPGFPRHSTPKDYEDFAARDAFRQIVRDDPGDMSQSPFASRADGS